MTTYRSALPTDDVKFDRPEDRIRQKRDADIEKVRNDSTVTTFGKQQKIAALELDARQRMQALEQQNETAYEGDVAKTTRKVFGIDDLVGSGRDAASVHADYRAACERAEAMVVDPQRMLAPLTKAIEVGDEIAARAYARTAIRQARTPIIGPAFKPVVDAYVSSRPNVSDAVNKLLTAEGPSVKRDGFRYVLPTPTELVNRTNRSQATDDQLERLIEGEAIPGIGA